MTVERIVSLDARRARKHKAGHGATAANARHATTLWTAFRANAEDGMSADPMGEDRAGALPMRVVLVLLSVIGTLLAITAWFTRGFASGLLVYLVTLCAIGLVLWRASRGASSDA